MLRVGILLGLLAVELIGTSWLVGWNRGYGTGYDTGIADVVLNQVDPNTYFLKGKKQ